MASCVVNYGNFYHLYSLTKLFHRYNEVDPLILTEHCIIQVLHYGNKTEYRYFQIMHLSIELRAVLRYQ